MTELRKALLAGLIFAAGSPLAVTWADERPLTSPNLSAAHISQRSTRPPPADGYFRTRPAGAWRSLPSESVCAGRVHRSAWEPRQVNRKRDRVTPPLLRVHRALAVRPRNIGGTYSKHWDAWLLPRVDGQFTGTTDEIFQWAACKWGLSDNLLRSIAVRESTWYQYPTYRNGRCVTDWGCGDMIDRASRATRRFCDGIARFGYDYQRDYGDGRCPRTFSIMGVMSWQAPSWGHMRGNQNGTFPFSRNSTAYAVDYAGAYLRGCMEGWVHWLDDTGTRTYARNKIWGCVGSWYSGSWRDDAANGYIRHVKHEMRQHRWLQSSWPTIHPPCSPKYGCPGPDPLPVTRNPGGASASPPAHLSVMLTYTGADVVAFLAASVATAVNVWVPRNTFFGLQVNLSGEVRTVFSRPPSK